MLRFSALAALAIVLAAGPASADVRITLNYTKTTEKGARQEMRIVVLGKDGKLHITGKSEGPGEEVSLGAPKLAVSSFGRQYVERDTIRGGQIVIGSFFHTFKIITTISTNGRDSCTARREYRLNPGFSYYQDTPDSPKTTFRSVSNMTCAIEAMP